MPRLLIILLSFALLGYIHGGTPGGTPPPANIPINTSLPSLSTAPLTIGNVASSSTGGWSNCIPSCTFTYQFYGEGFAIGGATSTSTYTLASGDLAHRMQVGVVATNSVGSSTEALSVVSEPVINSTVRYVSSSTGNDSNAGTIGAPWQTLNKVNTVSLSSGTSVLFKRGDVWRDGNNGTLSGLHAARLIAKAGVHYDAYGTGANPQFMGSVSAASTSDWTNIGGNIWTSTSVFQPTGANPNGKPVENANDVGLITYGSFPGPRTVAQMVDLPGQSDASLTTQGKWLFNTTDWKVHIFSVGNPATAMAGLELGMDADVIYADFVSNVIFQNITVYHTAGHGLASGFANTNITVRDCIFGWIGGGNLNGAGTRYGNGIQASAGVTNWLAERNWVFESYDGNIVIEEFSSIVNFDTITIRNNVVYNAPTLIAVTVTNASSTISNINIYNNTAANPAGNTNRPPGNGNQHQDLNTKGVVPSSNYVVKNNSFTYGHEGFTIENYTWAQGTAVWDYNNWVMDSFVHSWNPALDTLTISAWAAAYTPPAETHGLLGTAPQYVDYTLGDIDPNNLAPVGGSPLRNAGTNLFSAGVVWDFNRTKRPSSGAVTIGAFQ